MTTSERSPRSQSSSGQPSPNSAPFLPTARERQNLTPFIRYSYERLCLRAALARTPNVFWCLSSTCDAGQVHRSEADADQDVKSLFVCNTCSFESCTTCTTPWHHVLSCEAAPHARAAATVNERASLALVESSSVPCPNHCGARIQKVAGCDYIRCRICNHDFCWRCRASYAVIRASGNAGHKETCKHWQATGHFGTFRH